PRTVATGWAPYRYGHWAWVEPWGWTWIDDAPWGFAPFHYGRWVYVGNGWAWVPGRVVARPVYAPALVVFVGGRNWSVAIGAGGGGGVAWFPLAPEEPYYPAYHVSNTYVRNVNVTNVNVTNINVTNVNVTNINYRNRRAPDAVTVVSHDAFVQSRPVNRSVIVVARDRLDQARVGGSAARVTTAQPSVRAPCGKGARRLAPCHLRSSRSPSGAGRPPQSPRLPPPPPPPPPPRPHARSHRGKRTSAGTGRIAASGRRSDRLHQRAKNAPTGRPLLPPPPQRRSARRPSRSASSRSGGRRPSSRPRNGRPSGIRRSRKRRRRLQAAMETKRRYEHPTPAAGATPAAVS